MAMSGLAFFSGDSFDKDDSSTGNDHEQHDDLHPYPQQQHQHSRNAERERLSTHLALRRLLYRMERYEDLSVLTTAKTTNTTEGEDEKDDTEPKAQTSGSHQSWHSLLVRARLCQDLWHTVAAQNVDQGSDPRLRREYMELSQRVDAACKRAHVLADKARLEEESTGGGQDLVGRLFFPDNDEEDESKADGEEFEDGDGTTEVHDDGESDTHEDNYYDEFEEEEEVPRHKNKPQKNHHNHNRNEEDSLQELQKAQQEQMEEAISMMAKQMKESTMGLQTKLQQQTTSTMDELETVAEQNLEDVTKVASSVKEHVSARSKSAWATWTMMILLAGVFAFTLATIFTVPKHPSASLGSLLSFRSGKGTAEGNGPYKRLVQKAIKRIRSVFHSEFDETEEEQDDEDKGIGENDDEDEAELDAERQEAERLQLEELVRDMRRGGRKTKEQHQHQEQQPTEEEESEPNEEDAFVEEEPIMIVNKKRHEEKPDIEEKSNQEPYEEEANTEEYVDEERDFEERFEKEDVTEEEEAVETKFDNPWGIEPEIDEDLPESQNNGDDGERVTEEETNEERYEEEEHNEEDRDFEEEEEANEERYEEKDEKEAAEKNHDNPWGIESEEDIQKQEQQQQRSSSRRQRWQERREKQKQAEREDPTPPKEASADNIMASLQQQQQQQQLQQEASNSNSNHDDVIAEEAPSDPVSIPSENSARFDPTHSFQREGMAAKQISPRDFRVAAASNDLETLVRYLETAPEHINRQDKYGWTALHLAVNANHEAIVKLLLEKYSSDVEGPHNVDVGVHSYEEDQNPMDFALARYGFYHPLPKARKTTTKNSNDPHSQRP